MKTTELPEPVLFEFEYQSSFLGFIAQELEYICNCKKCGWCRDALIEGAERINERRLSIAEALTSPKWYEREAVELYNEWKEKDLC